MADFRRLDGNERVPLNQEERFNQNLVFLCDI
jgi:hypothetical protein